MKIPARALALGLSLVVVFVLVARFGALRDRMGSDLLVSQVEARTVQISQFAGGGVPLRLLHENVEILRRAEDLDPHQVGVPLSLGGQYLLMRKFPAAERAYRDALSMEPRAEIYGNLTRALLAAGDTEGARITARAAVQLDRSMHRHFSSLLRPVSPPSTGRSPLLFVDSFESGDTRAWSYTEGGP